MELIKKPFRPKAKLLLELGDQLIKDEGIALFELVKNAYDADATNLEIEMRNIDSPERGDILITDNGVGMTMDTVLGVWLEPGTDFRQKQIENGIYTKRFKRVPLGEKGIGRFGAHKLGKKIELVTRAKGNNEIIVEVNWEEFEKDEYLEDISVAVRERRAAIFTGDKTGTRIKISNLRTSWNRGMVRDINRAINSICSPYHAPDSFKAILKLSDKDKSDWLENLFSWEDVLRYQLFHAVCAIDGNQLTYSYEFSPWEVMNKVTKRKTTQKISMVDGEDKNRKSIDLGRFGIGKVTLELNIYDLEVEVLSISAGIDRTGLKDFLKFNGGIRVYRDGIRVYDYGEPGNDWLELGTRRVNLPTDRLSNNIVLGQVNLSRLESTDLIEKTNREGFIENDAVKTLRKAIVFAITQIESERNKDKLRLRAAYSGKGRKYEPVIDDLVDLRKKLEKKKLIKEFEPSLQKIENNFRDIKEKLLTSAGAGLSFSIVIHEIQKIIKELKIITTKDRGAGRIKKLVQRLSDLTEGYAMLIRQEGKVTVRASELIRQSEFNMDYRLKTHGIEVINQLDSKKDFKIKCSRRLILGAIMNIIDNSIWWIENKKPTKKYLFLSVNQELKEGPAIIIGDNGSGFMDELEYVVQPFFTRKPDGMGLGLHIANEVMKVHQGKIKIIRLGDIRIPKEIDGAILALVFPKKVHGDK
jgi:signal transduction histidine kinase/anti-sigma regulatory factor (Ser/Thr protein kinase)